jgi:hypothetical protein
MTLGTPFKIFRSHWAAAGHRCTIWFFLVVVGLVLASPGWLSYWRAPWKPAFAGVAPGMSMQQVHQVMGEPTDRQRVEAAPYGANTPVVRWTYRSPFRMVSYTVCFDRYQQVCANSMAR